MQLSSSDLQIIEDSIKKPKVTRVYMDVNAKAPNFDIVIETTVKGVTLQEVQQMSEDVDYGKISIIPNGEEKPDAVIEKRVRREKAEFPEHGDNRAGTLVIGPSGKSTRHDQK